MTELKRKDKRIDRKEQVDGAGKGPEWDEAKNLLGIDLSESARAQNAIQRFREVASGEDALLMALRYSALDMSLGLAGAWVTLNGISASACRQRLRKMGPWLETLTQIGIKKLIGRPDEKNLDVELVDASVICQPGSQGIDWRLHVEYSLGEGQVTRVRLTDVRGGESFKHLTIKPGQLLIGDRGYCSRPGVVHVLQSGGHVLVRWNSGNLPLLDEAGADLNMLVRLKALSSSLQPGQVQEISGRLKLGRPATASPPVRVILKRLDPEVAERARRRVRKAAQKEHHCPAELSLICCDFLILITDPNPWPAELLAELYRARWQIELLFKQLKSIAQINHLRVKDPVLVQVYFFGKLLAWILGHLFWVTHHAAPPAQLPDRPQRQLSAWRLARLIWDTICSHLTPDPSLTPDKALTLRLQRYLYPPPRARSRQSVTARGLIHAMA